MLQRNLSLFYKIWRLKLRKQCRESFVLSQIFQQRVDANEGKADGVAGFGFFKPLKTFFYIADKTVNNCNFVRRNI